MKLSQAWKEFCGRGNYSKTHQERSVRQCVTTDGKVRGYYSDLPLDPNLPFTDSMHPSHDHTTYPKRHQSMVVDARVVNDMKTILIEQEFWSVVEHLYAVGLAKGKIPARRPRRLSDHWHPRRNFDGA